MTARWEPTPEERRGALLENGHPALTLALVLLLVTLVAVMGQVAS